MSQYAISKSSLLSLKAEILRKQEEVGKVKLQNKAKILNENKKGTPLDLKNKGVNERQLNDHGEDEDLLKKSKSALEAKAKLYDQLSKGVGNDDEDNVRYLVRFDKKQKRKHTAPVIYSDDDDDIDRYQESDEERHFSDEYDPPSNAGDEWIEYVDCLGRTRKCLRKDLDYIKDRDSDLKFRINKEGNAEPEKVIEIPEYAETITEECDEDRELSDTDIRRELLRRKWDQEEEELQNKADIHYQDILFDEARMHGVGYYGFSKDQKERIRQQEALKKLREETRQEQKKAETLKQMRDKQLAARTKAARNRKRARMGLPPEEEGEEPEEIKMQDETNDKNDAEQKEDLQKEKERELLRQKHIRPWDLGKEGVKEHVEYTQEDWVQKKRRDRQKEFAPPSLYVHESSSKNSLYFTTKRGDKHDRKFSVDTARPPPKINNPSKKRLNPYGDENCRSRSQNVKDAVPIVNECVDFDDEQDRLLRDYGRVSDVDSDSDDSSRGRGTEIAPPPTFDYYGPSGSKKSKANLKAGSIEDSIYAGLQFLRKQAEKKDKSTKHPHEMFLS